MGKLTITAKIDSKEAKLTLTEMEVESALSICNVNGTEEVIVMKKVNGGAIFAVNQRSANSIQERHGFDYAFTVKKDALEKHFKDNPTKSNKPAQKSA